MSSPRLVATDPPDPRMPWAIAASRIAAAEAGAPALPIGVALACILLLSGVVGVLIAFGSLPLLVLAGGGLAGAFAILLPLEFLLWSLLVLTLFVQGPIANFLKLPAAAWLPYGMAALLFLRSLLELLGGRARRRPKASAGPIPALLLLYLGVIAAAAVVNRSPLSQIAVGLKTYVPFWAVTFVLLFNAWDARQLARLWRLLPWGLLLQVPVVAYQVLVVVPGRRAVGTRSAFDAVVGTFGGDGGNSSFLVLFCIAATVLAFARAQLGIGRLSVAVGVLVVSVALTFGGEVKAAYLWVPLAIAVAFHDRLLKRPAVLVGATVAMALFVIAMSATYEAMHWRHQTVDNRPLLERIQRSSDYFFNPSQVNYETGEISRGASIALWLNDRRTDWPNRLVGYGPAASRAKSVVAIGRVAKRFAPLAIAATTVAMLLWDAGVLALGFFVALLVAAQVTAIRLMHAPWLPAPHRAACRMAAAVFAIDFTLLFYNRSLVDEPCTQLTLALLVGYVAWLQVNRPGAVATDCASMLGFAFTRLLTGLLGLFVPVVLARAMPLEAYADYLLILSAAMLAITLGSFGYDRAAYRFLPPLVVTHDGAGFARLASLLAGARVLGAGAVAGGLAFAGDVLPAFGVATIPGGWPTVLGLVVVLAWSEAAGVIASTLSRHRLVAAVNLVALAGRSVAFAALLLSDRLLGLERVLQVTFWAELAQALVLSSVAVQGVARLVASGAPVPPSREVVDPPRPGEGGQAPPDLATVARCCASAWGAYLASMPTQGPALRLLVGAFADSQTVAAFGFFQQLADRARAFLPLQLVLSNIETILSARRASRPDGDPSGLRALAVMTRLNLVVLALGLVTLAAAGTELEQLLTAGRFAAHLDLAALIIVQLMLASIGASLWTAYNATGDAVLLNRCSMLASAASVPVVVGAAVLAGAHGIAAVSSIRVIGLCLLLVRGQGRELARRLLACPREVRAQAVMLTAIGVALLASAGLQMGGVSGLPALAVAWSGFVGTAALLKWVTHEDLSSIGRLVGRPDLHRFGAGLR